MPNQDPTQNQNNQNPVAQPGAIPVQEPSTVPPVISPQADLPPLPPDFQNIPEESSATPATPSEEQTGSAAPPPPDISSVIPTPKKKFGGGKIIATILGIILLVGGVGVGVVLTSQQQLFQQKAATTSGVGGPDCWGQQCTLGSTKCQEDKKGNNTGYNCTCIDLSPNAIDCVHDWQCTTVDTKSCPTSNGGPGANKGQCSDPDVTKGSRCLTSTTAKTFGKYTCPNQFNMSGGCQSNEQIKNVTSVCFDDNFCGTQQIDLGSDTSCFISVEDHNCSSPTPKPSTSPSPSTAPSCTDIKAFKGTSTTAMTTDGLSSLQAGDSVTFCAFPSLNKATFTINGVAQTPVTITTGAACMTARGSCLCSTPYIIPAGVSTFNVSAVISN